MALYEIETNAHIMIAWADSQAAAEGHTASGEDHWTNQRPDEVTRGEDHGRAVLTEELAFEAIELLAQEIGRAHV